MNPEIKAELWRLAQAAFDAHGLASEDPAVLDLLVEHPELACEMDQLLIVEQRLQVVQAAAPAVASKQPLVLGVAVLVAAALAIAWVPSLWEQGKQPATQDHLAESPQGQALPVQDPVVVTPTPVIESFELAIVRHRPQGVPTPPGTTGAAPQPARKVPLVHSLTSSRTRTAPRGANTTF